MTRRLSSFPLAAAILAAVLSGCGGDSAQTVPTSSLGHAEFVKRADAICAQGRLKGIRYDSSGNGQQSERAALAAGIESNLLPAIQATIDKMYALGAPQAEAEQVEELLSDLQQAVDEGNDLPTPTLGQVERLFAQSGKLARRIGLESCAYG